MNFEMQIKNVFALSDGRTMLVGKVSGHPGLIRSCRCSLMRGDEVRQVIDCEGEQIVKKTEPENDLRSIGAVASVDLSQDEAQTGLWRLVCQS